MNYSNLLRLVLVAALMAAATMLRSSAAPPSLVPPVISLPTIPPKVFPITDYGAVGDGKTVNTVALQKAIATCGQAGGGTVLVPAGRFLTGPLTLASNLNLHLDKGAILLMSSRVNDYTQPNIRNLNCITATNCHDIALTGSGTVDGQGGDWWPRYKKGVVPQPGDPPLIHRPYMVVFTRCTRVLVQDVLLTNSPSFHLVPAQCQDVTVQNIHILAPADAPNTDGMDPSGWNYLIENCTFDVGDDNIALKPSGLIAPGQPSCKNFLIQRCTFLHGHGMSIGGQSPGGLDGLTVRDCTFNGTQAGIRMKAPRGSGGLVENLTYENLTMTNVKMPIYITSYYPKAPADPSQDPSQPVNPTTPIWRHIHITNLTASGGPMAGQILGLPEMPVSDVVLTNVKISADKGMEITNATGIRFVNSQITAKKGPALIVQKGEIAGLDPASGQQHE